MVQGGTVVTGRGSLNLITPGQSPGNLSLARFLKPRNMGKSDNNDIHVAQATVLTGLLRGAVRL